jgi:hypothetical protein
MWIFLFSGLHLKMLGNILKNWMVGYSECVYSVGDPFSNADRLVGLKELVVSFMTWVGALSWPERMGILLFFSLVALLFWCVLVVEGKPEEFDENEFKVHGLTAFDWRRHDKSVNPYKVYMLIDSLPKKNKGAREHVFQLGNSMLLDGRSTLIPLCGVVVFELIGLELEEFSTDWVMGTLIQTIFLINSASLSNRWGRSYGVNSVSLALCQEVLLCLDMDLSDVQKWNESLLEFQIQRVLWDLNKSAFNDCSEGRASLGSVSVG